MDLTKTKKDVASTITTTTITTTTVRLFPFVGLPFKQQMNSPFGEHLQIPSPKTSQDMDIIAAGVYHRRLQRWEKRAQRQTPAAIARMKRALDVRKAGDGRSGNQSFQDLGTKSGIALDFSIQHGDSIPKVLIWG
jgi:hypothetical protein